MKSKKKCVIYARFSPRRNESDCRSNEIQVAYCEQHCQKKGYEVLAIFEDEAVSGKDEYREKMWQAIKATPKDGILLVYKRDRLARNVYLSEHINRQVKAGGAVIEAVEGDVEGDGPESVLIRQVLSAISEYERMIISQRTSAAMKHYVKTGEKRIGRFPPYGWENDDKDETKYRKCDPEQVIIKRILQLYPKHGSCHATAIALNDEKTPARGSRWHTKTVWKILKRESVIE